jgi:hypothetical protein
MQVALLDKPLLFKRVRRDQPVPQASMPMPPLAIRAYQVSMYWGGAWQWDCAGPTKGNTVTLVQKASTLTQYKATVSGFFCCSEDDQTSLAVLTLDSHGMLPLQVKLS